MAGDTKDQGEGNHLHKFKIPRKTAQTYLNRDIKKGGI